MKRKLVIEWEGTEKNTLGNVLSALTLMTDLEGPDIYTPEPPLPYKTEYNDPVLGFKAKIELTDEG